MDDWKTFSFPFWSPSLAFAARFSWYISWINLDHISPNYVAIFLEVRSSQGRPVMSCSQKTSKKASMASFERFCSTIFSFTWDPKKETSKLMRQTTNLNWFLWPYWNHQNTMVKQLHWLLSTWFTRCLYKRKKHLRFGKIWAQEHHFSPISKVNMFKNLLKLPPTYSNSYSRPHLPGPPKSRNSTSQTIKMNHKFSTQSKTPRKKNAQALYFAMSMCQGVSCWCLPENVRWLLVRLMVTLF